MTRHLGERFVGQYIKFDFFAQHKKGQFSGYFAKFSLLIRKFTKRMIKIFPLLIITIDFTPNKAIKTLKIRFLRWKIFFSEFVLKL